jgi:hypothetical protein
MEADAERVRRLAGCEEQLLHLAGLRAELGSKAELGVIGGHADADAQVQILRAVGGADDLFELIHRVEREGANAKRIGFGDRLLGFHRVHEAELRFGKRFRHQPHFGERGDVVMRHAAVPKDAKQVRGRVRLHRIERAARKLLNEEAGGAPGGVRTKQRNRLNRVRLCDLGTGKNGAGRGDS